MTVTLDAMRRAFDDLRYRAERLMPAYAVLSCQRVLTAEETEDFQACMAAIFYDVERARLDWEEEMQPSDARLAIDLLIAVRRDQEIERRIATWPGEEWCRTHPGARETYRRIYAKGMQK